MSSIITNNEANILHSINSDEFKNILSFCTCEDISVFARTARGCYFVTKQYYLDTVHHIAWIDEKDNHTFHIKHISSAQKNEKVKDLWKMTCHDDVGKEEQILDDEKCDKNQEFLLENNEINTSFNNQWAMFIRKQHYGIDLDDTKGYWKVLPHDHYLIKDLQVMKLLVLHKQIATKLLIYSDDGGNPFKHKITVRIHDKKAIRKYDILFWNGASPSQCNAFEIYDHKKKRTRYYMNFNSNIPYDWYWYDNDSSRFKIYDLGPIVKAQIECSFQANLLYNFPYQFQEDEIFNNVNLTILRREFIKEFGGNGGNNNDKVFLLRCGYDEDNMDETHRKIVNMEQLTVSTYGFPRSVKRIDTSNGKLENDFCHCIEDNFSLRMKQKDSFSNIVTRVRSNAVISND